MNEMLKNAFSKAFNDVFVGEYSPDQKCYNICTLNEALKTNREMMQDGNFSGYIPLCIGTRDRVKEDLNEIEKKYGRP